MVIIVFFTIYLLQTDEKSQENSQTVEVEAEVYDALGKVLLHKTLDFTQNKEQTLNLQGFSAGTYLLILRSEGKEEKYKLMKED